jgi:hypothetical protein
MFITVFARALYPEPVVFSTHSHPNPPKQIYSNGEGVEMCLETLISDSRYCTTSQKVTGPIPDEVIEFLQFT